MYVLHKLVTICPYSYGLPKIYDMEVCPLTKSDLRALDFVVDRFFMKLFQTSNMDVIRHAQCMFNFTLPSLLIKKNVAVNFIRVLRNC